MDSLVSASPPSQPFPISDQYAPSFRFRVGAKPADSAEAEKAPDPQMPLATPRFKFKVSLKKVSKNVKKKAGNKRKETTDKQDHIYGNYVPNNFLERAKAFIAETRRCHSGRSPHYVG